MQGNESFASHVNNSQMEPGKSAESALITLERSQKLDLLIHLISNLKQSLVICGPQGIGKTVLLNEFKTRKQELWPICEINATAQLSFEHFEEQLLSFLNQVSGEYQSQELLSILSGLDKQNQKLVVILDNAGQLVPGLINTIIQYASATSCLRIVFSLTHDELHIKNSSDRAVDDCHFIDIPPLTKKQCGVFLQNLSAKPGAVVSFDAINDRLVEKLYQETHGIPGRIVSELPKLSNYQAVAGYKWGGIALVSAIVATGIAFVLHDGNDSVSESVRNETQSVILKKAEVVEISKPVVQQQKMEAVETESSITTPEKNTEQASVIVKHNEEFENVLPVNPVGNKDIIKESPQLRFNDNRINNDVPLQITTLAADNSDKDAKLKKSKSSAQLNPELKERDEIQHLNERKLKVDNSNGITGIKKDVNADPQQTKALSVVELENKKPAVKVVKFKNDKKIAVKAVSNTKNNHNQWVISQSGKDFTIQLMVLSKRDSVLDFFKKHQSLRNKLKYIELRKNNQVKYTILYGSFKNAKAALNNMKSLPVKYRKSWVRRFRELQKEIKK